MLGLGKGLEIEHIRIQESFLRKQVLVVNKRILSVREKFTLKDKVVQRVFDNDFDAEEQKTVVEKLSLHNIYANAQSKEQIPCIILFRVISHIPSQGVETPFPQGLYRPRPQNIDPAQQIPRCGPCPEQHLFLEPHL